MTRYLLTRLLQAAASVAAMTLIIFVLSHTLGDPLDARLSLTATAEDRANLAREFGLDRPLWEQYVTYVGRLARGDLGRSITFDRPVASLIGDRLAATLTLAVAANLLSLAVGVPLGVLTAVRAGSQLDRVIRVAVVAGQSMPPFWTALGLVLLFAVNLRWLPTSGLRGPGSYVLPVTTMTLFIVPGIVRLVRAAMLEALAADFIRFGRSLRIPERLLVWRYGLRAASLPVLTFASLIFLSSLTGAVVTETVFAWPGLGRLVVQSVFNRDFPLVEGIVVLFSVLYSLGNLVVDLLYTLLDPRIRLASEA